MGKKRKHVNLHPRPSESLSGNLRKFSLFSPENKDISGCQFQILYNLCRIHDQLAGSEKIKLQDKLVANYEIKAHILSLQEEKEEEVVDGKEIKGKELNWS